MEVVKQAEGDFYANIRNW